MYVQFYLPLVHLFIGRLMFLVYAIMYSFIILIFVNMKQTAKRLCFDRPICWDWSSEIR